MKIEFRNRAKGLRDVARYQVLHLRKNLFECWIQIFKLFPTKIMLSLRDSTHLIRNNLGA